VREKLYALGSEFREQTKTNQSNLSVYDENYLIVLDQKERKPYQFDLLLPNLFLLPILKNPSLFRPIPVYDPIPELNESSVVSVPNDFAGTFKDTKSQFEEVKGKEIGPHWIEIWKRLEPYIWLENAAKNSNKITARYVKPRKHY
jgi:hypothetical protein